MNQEPEQLFCLLQCFAALVSVKNIGWPSSVSADETQEFLIQQLIFSSHFRSYPPSENYQKSFWKWVIANLEEQGEEVKEEIYSCYLALLDKVSIDASLSIQPPSPSYVTYIWSDTSQDLNGGRHSRDPAFTNYRSCTLFEARTTIESGTTGLRTWTASFVLADYLISNRSMLKASRILELGSGAGFLGIILAQLQIEASEQAGHAIQPFLYLSDMDENVLTRCEANVKLPCNNVSSHPEVHFRTLDWSDALDETRRTDLSVLLAEVNVDLLLGADVVYDVAIIPSLVATLHLALTPDYASPSRKKAIIAATLRNESTLCAFVKEVRESRLCIEEVETRQDGLSRCFLRSQPDTIGENRNHVKIFIITNINGSNP